ncbi:MAG: hypothetical protein AB1649_35030, partial [Chloroflexota bacterium]
RALDMSAANVRHHLSVLVADGRAEVMSARRLDGKGRPEKLYSISRAALGDNLAALASALLAEAGPEVQMEGLANRIVAGREVAPNQPMGKILASLVEKMNEMNYQARWEAGAEGPRVILGLCPYAAIIEKHPLLCRMDASILSKMLGRDVEQRLKLAPMCVFAVS